MQISINQKAPPVLIRVHSRSFAVPHPFFVSLRGLFLSKVNGNGNAAVAEPTGILFEVTRDPRAAVRAKTPFCQAIVPDLVPVARDEQCLAGWTIGRAARSVMHIAGVNVVKPRRKRDSARSIERSAGLEVLRVGIAARPVTAKVTFGRIRKRR